MNIASSSVICRRSVDAIKDANQVFSQEFSEVFSDTFDTLEFRPPEPIELEALIDQIEAVDDKRIAIDYDKNATVCSISVAGVAGEIEVTSDTLSLIKRRPESPALLLDSFFKIQEALTEIYGVKAIDFQ